MFPARTCCRKPVLRFDPEPEVFFYPPPVRIHADLAPKHRLEISQLYWYILTISDPALSLKPTGSNMSEVEDSSVKVSLKL